MTDWNAAFQDELDELGRRPAARPPATFGEIWNAEWRANGLETTFGVRKPMVDAYEELHDRLTAIAGKDLGTLARERNLDFMAGGLDGRVETMGKIIDSLPDQQQKLLADYKDVRGRARQKAADIERESADVAGATYGLSGYATAFAAGVARQFFDPVNLATAPIGGPAKGPVLKWLGKEFLIGAGTQAAQEPLIAPRRAELGLETNSLENIIQAGIGQAGFSGLLRGAAAAWRAGRKAMSAPDLDLTPDDLDAVARQAQTDAIFDNQTGASREAADHVRRATEALNGNAPIEAVAPQRAVGFSLEGPQRVIISDDLRLEVRYAVVERASLITSHTATGEAVASFPADLQPRDRSTDAMRRQSQKIAALLDPELLGPSPNAQQGAPIVSDRGVVESGNGRTIAIGLAYDRFPERAQAYRDYLDTLGFDTGAMREPVLVRIRQTDLPPAELLRYTSAANVGETAPLSVPEQAMVDAKRLHGGILSNWQGGNLDAARNAEFVRRFVAEIVPVSEHNTFAPENKLTIGGMRRMEAALLARAWGDPRLVKELVDNPNQTSITILRAFADTAPQISRVRGALDDGRIDPSVDIVTPLKAAFDIVDQARAQGRKLSYLVEQGSLESGFMAEDVRAAIQLFFRNSELTLPAARETIETRIAHAAEQALMSQGGGLFADTIDAAALLRAARFASESIDATNLTAIDRQRLMGEAGAGRVVDLGRPDADVPRRKDDGAPANDQPALQDVGAPSSLSPAASPQSPPNVLEFRQAKLEQPFTDLDTLFALAPASQKELISALEAIRIGKVKDPGLKARDGERGIEAKVKRKGYDDIREVTDVARGGIVIDRPSDAEAIIASLSQKFQIWDEGWKVNDVGYADRKVMVRTSNKLIAEVQILETSYLAAKEVGHQMYEDREAFRLAGDINRAKETKAQEIAYWRDVQRALSDDWRAALGLDPNAVNSEPNASRANASSMGRPSSPISPELTDTQPRLGDNTNPSNVASSTMANRASQLNNLNGASDIGPSFGMVARGDAEINTRVKSMVNEIGEETRLPFEQSDGSMKDMTVKERMAEVEQRQRAAAELNDCIARNGGPIRDADP